MWTQEKKKAFALEHLRGYYHNPETCGYEEGSCKYLTEKGQKCMFGKFLLKPEDFQLSRDSANGLLDNYKEADILKPEVVGVFTPEEWRLMQRIHDAIASNNALWPVDEAVKKLGWFTYEELIAKDHDYKTTATDEKSGHREPDGELKGYPVEIVEKMLEHQVAQGHKRDITVFEQRASTSHFLNGFTWNETEEGYDFWSDVINDKKFNTFFNLYPKKQMSQTYKVTREQLGRIHSIACVIWKGRITEITQKLLGSFKPDGELTHEQVEEMFNAATPEQLPVLKEIFPRYTVKTFIPKGKMAWVRDYLNNPWEIRVSDGKGNFYVHQKLSGEIVAFKQSQPFNEVPDELKQAI